MDELRTALELATEEELQQLTQILFCRKFNPLDYFATPEPLAVQSQNREAWLESLEQRFRYLAADGLTVLQKRTGKVSYRDILIRVCHYLKISYSQSMKTTDLESEIFLHLVSNAWKKLPSATQKSLQVRVQQSLANSGLDQPLPVHLQHNPLNLILKGTGVVAVNAMLKSLILEHLARQFAIHAATYQTAKGALMKGGTVVMGEFQGYLAIQAAKRGMAISSARYGAVRTIFAVLGPLMWAGFVADLGWRAIATNYGRIIPTIFTLAQIRLTRSEYAWETV